MAWISGGKLAAAFKEIILPATVPNDDKPLDVHLLESYVTATLSPAGSDAGTPFVDVVVAGRWKTADFLDQVRQIHIEDTLGVVSANLCDSGQAAIAYGSIKAEVCDGRDIRSASRDDKKGLPCDAFSIGGRLTVYPVATAGPFMTAPPFTPRCADAAVPVGDDCP